jgi:hypothetical protein
MKLKQYWNDDLNLSKLTKNQYKKVLEEYNTLELFK